MQAKLLDTRPAAADDRHSLGAASFGRAVAESLAATLEKNPLSPAAAPPAAKTQAQPSSLEAF